MSGKDEEQEAEHPPALPALPRGHTYYPAWLYLDARGRTWEMHRVYGPDGRLRRDLSYWVVTWEIGAGDEAAPQSRWITFATARAVLGRISYREFASMDVMAPRLPALVFGPHEDEEIAAAPPIEGVYD